MIGKANKYIFCFSPIYLIEKIKFKEMVAMAKDLISKIVNNNGINVFESRDVAEMVGKTHSNLLRDIKNYIKGMEKDPKSSVISANSQDFFIESTVGFHGGNADIEPCVHRGHKYLIEEDFIKMNNSELELLVI